MQDDGSRTAPPATARVADDPAPRGGPSWRVLVHSEERLAGRALAALLSAAGSIEARYGGGLATADRLVPAWGAGAVVWLGRVADGWLFEALASLRASHPDLGICLLPERVDTVALRELVERRAGRLAVVLRTAELDVGDLLRALAETRRGRATLSSDVLQQLVCADGRAGAREIDALTPSERDVLATLAGGLRNREIARRLGRSEKLVERRVGRIFTKLNLARAQCANVDRRVMATRIFLAGGRPSQGGVPLDDIGHASGEREGAGGVLGRDR